MEMMVSNLPILLFCYPAICAISASLICFGSHFASSCDGFADNWYKYEVLSKARDQVFPSAKFTDPHGAPTRSLGFLHRTQTVLLWTKSYKVHNINTSCLYRYPSLSIIFETDNLRHTYPFLSFAEITFGFNSPSMHGHASSHSLLLPQPDL